MPRRPASAFTLRANSVSSRKPTICDPSLRAMLTSLVDSTKWLLSTRRQNVNRSFFVILFVMRKLEVFHQIETHRNPASFLMQRSEEPTSELQTLMRISYAIFCFKKKTHHIV